jgi:hypothetical protein
MRDGARPLHRTPGRSGHRGADRGAGARLRRACPPDARTDRPGSPVCWSRSLPSWPSRSRSQATTIIGEPSPTPTDIIGIADALRARGVTVSGLVSGDAGCSDPDMTAAAIRFSASGVDQAAPVTVRIFIFRNDGSYERSRPAVDACAAAWVVDPATFEAVDVSPYVITGQGPWARGFRDAVRAALTEAAGSG